MNLQNLIQNDALREKLASEYALGTLRGGARRRFEKWLQQDPLLQRSVADWQNWLNPLSEFAPDARPSPEVWQALENRLSLHAGPPRRSLWSTLQESLNFWRGLGMTSTALVAVLVTVLTTRQPDPVAPALAYIATLADDQAQLAVLVTGDVQRRQLTVRVTAMQQIPADKTLELWALPKNGAPRSLGLIARTGSVTLPFPENVTPDNVPALAISLEPEGGSPSPDGPTGPVLYKGAWIQI